ncbi:hypothetical protein QQF64_009601, partial [Cirrhinus molitorella]
VNFIACQVFGLAVAFWFRLCLNSKRTTPEVRHAVATIIGASFVMFCFGWYAIYVFILVLACYGIMIKASGHNIHRYTMIASVGYLTVCQVIRVFIFDYGILSTDFSGVVFLCGFAYPGLANVWRCGLTLPFSTSPLPPSIHRSRTTRYLRLAGLFFCECCLKLCEEMFAINNFLPLRPLALVISGLVLVLIDSMDLFYTSSQLHNFNYPSHLDISAYELCKTLGIARHLDTSIGLQSIGALITVTPFLQYL